jgi:hypothetical protein
VALEPQPRVRLEGLAGPSLARVVPALPIPTLEPVASAVRLTAPAALVERSPARVPAGRVGLLASRAVLVVQRARRAPAVPVVRSAARPVPVERRREPGLVASVARPPLRVVLADLRLRRARAASAAQRVSPPVPEVRPGPAGPGPLVEPQT